MINKLISLIAFSIIGFGSILITTNQAFAVSIFSNTCGNKAYANTAVCQDVNKQAKSSQDPIITIMKKIILIIAYITGAAAVIGILVSGARFISSGGDPNKVAGARTALTYSLIGLAVSALAVTIVAFLLDKI